MDEQTQEKPKTSLKRIVVILLLFFVVTIIMGIVLPGMVVYRPESYCESVESEARNIQMARIDYFSNPAQTDIDIKPGVLANTEHIKNPWTLSLSGDNILIQVTDGSGTCPTEYQARSPRWHSGIFTLKLFK